MTDIKELVGGEVVIEAQLSQARSRANEKGYCDFHDDAQRIIKALDEVGLRIVSAEALTTLSEQVERMRGALEKHACSCAVCERQPEDRDMCCEARAALSKDTPK